MWIVVIKCSIEGYDEVIVTWLDIHGKELTIRLDQYDFEISRLIKDFLKVFYEATNQFFASYYPTS